MAGSSVICSCEATYLVSKPADLFLFIYLIWSIWFISLSYFIIFYLGLNVDNRTFFIARTFIYQQFFVHISSPWKSKLQPCHSHFKCIINSVVYEHGSLIILQISNVVLSRLVLIILHPHKHSAYAGKIPEEWKWACVIIFCLIFWVF